MESQLTPQNITFVLGIMGIIFTIYRHFKDPDVEADKKAGLLAQQVQWSEQGTDRRFKDMQESFSVLVTNNQNHLHTVDTKVDALNQTVAAMRVDIGKLSTIIDERIPRGNKVV